MKISAIILASMDKIATPNTWTKHAFARNSKDEGVEVSSSKACKFCISGAIRSVITSDTDRPGVTFLIREIIRPSFGHINIPDFNDSSRITHAEVMQVMMGAAFTALADEESA